MSKSILVYSLAPFVLMLGLTLQKDLVELQNLPKKPPYEDKWVDSVFQTLSPREKIAQLFMVAAYSNRDEQDYAAMEALVRDYQIGGLIFFQGGPVRQAQLTNRYQRIAKVPLLIGFDGEWGLAMRLDSTISFPKQMTLGAIQENKLIYMMGAEIARQCKRIGIHVNFAPAVDVNSNPKNPVIGFRSFGENKYKVAEKGIAYMKGMQEAGIMATGKHFPGHGDTDTDSHYTLPLLNHDKTRLDTLELYPFKELIKNGLLSMMVAHLSIPAYDETPNKPTTLVKNVVTELLQNQMAFEGLIFTDAMNMKGISAHYEPGKADLAALVAGNDVVLFPQDVPKGIAYVEDALQKGTLSWEEVNKKVRKILKAKYFANLKNYQPIALENLVEDLNPEAARRLNENLYAQAITLVNNEDKGLPLQWAATDSAAMAVLQIGNALKPDLENAYQEYSNPFFKFLTKGEPNASLAGQFKNYGTIVVHLTDYDKNAASFGFGANVMEFITTLQQQTKVYVVAHGNVYGLAIFEGARNLIAAYEDNETVRRVIPRVLFGDFALQGKLPVSVSAQLKEGWGITVQAKPDLIRGAAERVGMDAKTLEKLDATINQAIFTDKMMPGCQLIVARQGVVVWDKAYGYYTYDKKQPVTLETIYDVASITKVVGTLSAIMYLYEKGLIDLDKKAVDYLPELAQTDKTDFTIKDLLTHQAGLTPFIPHWKKTMDEKNQPAKTYYSETQSDAFPNEVADNLYSFSGMEERLWEATIQSPREPKNAEGRYDYKYSDLCFYMLKQIAEKQLKQPIEVFLQEQFFGPMAMQSSTYMPLKKFSKEQITPTENDTMFRKRLVQGTVHDQGAAMLGGVGGHAGLFSTAGDLAAFMQMYLQKGKFQGKNYFEPETISLFTKPPFTYNRRALGWDRPDKEGISYFPADSLCPNAYGHSGFTGCLVFADPDQQLLFIFLSNRIYPDINTKMVGSHLRRKLLEIIYSAIIKDE